MCSFIKRKLKVWKREVLGDNTSAVWAGHHQFLFKENFQSQISHSAQGCMNFEVVFVQLIPGTNSWESLECWLLASKCRKYGKCVCCPFYQICGPLGSDSTDLTIFHLKPNFSYLTLWRLVIIIITISTWWPNTDTQSHISFTAHTLPQNSQ